MRVDRKWLFDQYLHDAHFAGREDRIDWGHGNKFALVSHHYFYFGKNAIAKSELPPTLPIERLFKRGPGFRRDFPPSALRSLTEWFDCTYETGMHGDPCASAKVALQPRRRRFSHCVPDSESRNARKS